MENLSFDSIRISLADPKDIEEKWSSGEVTKSETINYKTFKPERGGLFCQTIFGPVKDFTCDCNSHNKNREKGGVCSKCHIEITSSRVRRERLGIIRLASPVTHCWFLRGTPSRIGAMLDVKASDLEDVVHYGKYMVINPGVLKAEGIKAGDVIDSTTYEKYKAEDRSKTFVAQMGAEAILKLLAAIDVDALYNELKEKIENTSSENERSRLIRRFETVAAFKESGRRPEWMVLTVLPVMPPDLRPMVELDGGRFAVSDLNELYRRVVNRNNRLKDLIESHAPELMIRNEKRMLQEAVDALIDNGSGKQKRAITTGASNRTLKSLTSSLTGKQGRFRQNLLGKRVDYSGRSVIVVGPFLKMYQCGLPKEMALELFKPFVIAYLTKHPPKDANGGKTPKGIKAIRKDIDKRKEYVWDALDVVIKDHPVLLNRAPTLHRLGIQAFEPVLIEGKAIRLHPLVCTAFNADFDGDQMAVHVPLSAKAQAEARFMMLAAGNLLKPSDGKSVAVPTQDMILGSYYLTLVYPEGKGKGKAFSSVNEAMLAYDEGIIDLHAPIKIRVTKFDESIGENRSAIIETTLGKVIFNEAIPQDLGLVDRTDPENFFVLETEGLSSNGKDVGLVKKKQLGKIIDYCIRRHGIAETARVLDKIKDQGYKYSTKSGLSVSVFDATIPEEKAAILERAEEEIATMRDLYDRGLLSNDIRARRVQEIWGRVTEKEIKGALLNGFDRFNSIFMMLDSGARGNESQLNQLAGMRGLINSTSGKVIEVPIRHNYREGLNIQEYFISSRGARKGLTDTALKTADSGYLTRKLVDVSQDVVIYDDDCGSEEGLRVYDITNEAGRVFESFAERLTGRFLLKPFIDEETGEVIVDNDHPLREEEAAKIDAVLTEKLNKSIAEGNGDKDENGHLIRSLEIRSILCCNAQRGVCAKCYGSDLTTGQRVSIGEAVGIIAAQSIGEPGTQLTMRTFHTGGVASGVEDITQGLPRVTEIFESRKPKAYAIINEFDGVVTSIDKTGITVSDGAPVPRIKKYKKEFTQQVAVIEGQEVKKDDLLTKGSCHIPEILTIQGVDAVRDYIISQIQYTYRNQGVDINDKHIEIIASRMLKYVEVTSVGDFDKVREKCNFSFVEGEKVPKSFVDYVNRLIDEENKKIATEYEANAEAVAETEEGNEVEAKPEYLRKVDFKQLVMGLTKSAIHSASFLSAASFQETSKVLTLAAIAGKQDNLNGLKENVIIGKPIPCGTGSYSNIGYSEAE